MNNRKLFWVILILASGYWLLDSAIDAYIFQKGAFITQIFSATSHDILMRLLVTALLAVSVYSVTMIITWKKIEQSANAGVNRTLNMLNAFLNVTTDAVFIKDLEGRYLIANKATAFFIGKPVEEIIGQDDYSFFPSTDAKFLKERDRRIMESGNVDTSEERLLIHGKPHVFLAVKGPVFDSNGKVFGLFGISRDITERKQVENVLQEKEHLLSESQRIAHIGSWVWEMVADTITWTDETYRIFGRSQDTFPLSAESFISLLHPDDRPAMQEWIRRCMSGDKPGHLVFRIVMPDNTIRFIDGRGDLIYDAENNPTRMVGTAQDITERKSAEEALKEAELRFSSLMQAAGDAIIMSDASSNVLSWNAGAQKIFGYTAEEITGKSLTTLMPERYIKDHLNGMQRVIKTGQSQYLGRTLEFHGIRKDGTEFPIELSVNAWQTQQGYYFLGIIRDITARKELEKALIESRERLKTIINTEPQCVKLLNADGTLIEMNPAGLAMIEAESFEQVKGASLYSLLAPEHLNAFKSHVEEVFAGGSGTLEFEIIGLKNTHRWLSTHSVPFRDSMGEIIALLGITRDITEQKKLEDQFRQAQKMEAIGQLAGGIAHDFNNLLSAIMGYTHLTLMRMNESDPLRTNLDHVLEASDRAATLTQSLLAFSRKQTVHLSMIDFNDLIRKFEKFLLRLLREDIELKTICSEDPHGKLMIMADSGQLEQVLMNLVTNARDAMPEGGRLTIKTELAELDENFIEMHGFGKPGKYAKISVSDTGSGIDEETKIKIFEPFFTTKEVGRGTGLGLAMVYGTIKKHNGYINVYSEKDKGTTFRIYLPIATEEAEKEKTEKLETLPVQSGTETILVAEDDATLRKLSSTVLRHYGYNIIEAEDGEDAVRKFFENKERISLVILDGIMPKKNGKEAYEEIKILWPDIKAIFVSGYTSDIFGAGGALDKEINFITKPVSPIELAKKVREILDK